MMSCSVSPNGCTCCARARPAPRTPSLPPSARATSRTEPGRRPRRGGTTHPRTCARRESDELAQRLELLAQEREQLADGLTSIERELEVAVVAVESARVRTTDSATTLEQERIADRDTRDREASARAELFRADE